MKPVIVVGAGFSGLTLAHALHRLGVPVRVFERAERPGGLISTQQNEFGLVETAANALLGNADVDRLFAELELPFATPLAERRRRFIFWRKPRRWPLDWRTTFKLWRLPVARWFGIKRWQPGADESVRTWARRVINAQFEERLLAPALQGVYAGDVARLSARAVLARLFARGGPGRGRHHGSVAPVQGMGQLIERLADHLRAVGVEIVYGQEFVLEGPLAQPTVLCTSAWQAAATVAAHDPELSAQLKGCASLPLITVTAFYKPHAQDLKGFGCLFPEAQGFHALGVLMNDCIFAGRSANRSETWIFGGAKHRQLIDLDEPALLALLQKDRERLRGRHAPPLAVHVTRWPRAIPHYTVEWARTIGELAVKRPLFLHGNYLGSLGLAQIHQRSEALARQIKDLYVS